MKYEMYIQTDHNDGDYISETTSISEEKLNKFKPLISAIKEQNGNFGRGDVFEYDLKELYPEFDEALLEDFASYCPSDCYAGFHTVERVEVYPLPVKERLL